MSMKSFALAGAAIVALTVGGVGVAQADEQDDEVRQLNLEQLDQARADGGDTMAPMSEPAADPDGQGGPEFLEPPTPDEGMEDEGMEDDEPGDEPAADDEEDMGPDGPFEDDQPE